jgi:hypothetical protein
MKIIFLDIDGVLNCEKTPNSRKFPYVVDKKLLLRVNGLVERTRAKVVLSSSWRCDPANIGGRHSSTFARIGPRVPAARKC